MSRLGERVLRDGGRGTNAPVIFSSGISGEFRRLVVGL
jgi:hypothetical protein